MSLYLKENTVLYQQKRNKFINKKVNGLTILKIKN